jgi:hypothetical protein
MVAIGDIDVGENRPLGRLTSIALARDKVYVGRAASAFVDVYSRQGHVQPSVDVDVAQRTPTRADYQQAVDRMVGRFTDRLYRERMRSEVARIPMPSRLPFYGELFAGPDETLWVVISAPADPVTLLRVIGSDGAIIGDVSLPSAAIILEVGRDYILASRSPKELVPRLVMYGPPHQGAWLEQAYPEPRRFGGR